MDPEEILKALDPYVAGGTRILWAGEDYRTWRGGFEGGEYVVSNLDLSCA